MQENEGFESDISDTSSDCNSSSSRSSDSASSTSSSSSSSNEEISDQFELAKFGKHSLTIPKEIIENPNIFKEFFSVDTWRSLPENYRSYLKNNFLPTFSENNSYEQDKTVYMLFSEDIKRFEVSPLKTIYRNLEQGNYQPDVYKLRQCISKSKRREKRFTEYERLSQMAKNLIIAREKLLCRAYFNHTGQDNSDEARKLKMNPTINVNDTSVAKKARKRYYDEINLMCKNSGVLCSSDENENFDENLKYNKKKFKSGTNGWKEDSPLPSIPSNDFKILGTIRRKRKINLYGRTGKLLSNRSLKIALMEHRKKKQLEPERPELDTSDIRLRDIYTRAQISFTIKKLPKETSYLKNTDEPKNVDTLNSSEPLESERIVEPTKLPEFNSLNNNSFTFSDEDDEIINSKNNPSLNDVYVPTIAGDILKESPTDNIQSNNCSIKVLSEPSTDSLLQIHYHGKISAATVSDLEGIDMMGLPVDLDESCDLDLYTDIKTVPPQTVTTKQIQVAKSFPNSQKNKLSIPSLQYNTEKSLNQEIHICFLSLIRDIFCSTPNHRMKMEELKEKISNWSKSPIAALNEWYYQSDNWYSLIASAINFLTGEYFEPQDDFVPYIEYKSNLNIYQWIGAGRDTDNNLLSLCKQWLVIKTDKNITERRNIDTEPNRTRNITSDLEDVPMPSFRTDWKVRKATTEEIEEFRNQERKRFESPHMSFTYKQYGYESIVGPVKGIYAPVCNVLKSRVLSNINNRPSFITMLTLVRDAVARLPNGEGTVSDICELLRSSQYVNTDSSISELNSIVTGALDRLLSDRPPFVSFDKNQLLWIYLHRNKSEEDFERIHNSQTKALSAKKSSFPKKQKISCKAQSAPLISPLVKNISVPPTTITTPRLNQLPSSKSVLKLPTATIESSTNQVVQVKSPQKLLVNTTRMKTTKPPPQQIKVVTPTGLQTVNVAAAIDVSAQVSSAPKTNIIKPIIISTSNTTIGSTQSNIFMPVITNNLQNDLVEPQTHMKVISSLPNAIITNASVINQKIMKTSPTTSIVPSSTTVRPIQSVISSNTNPSIVTMPKHIVRLGNSQIGKNNILSLPSNTISQQNKIIGTTVQKNIAIKANTSVIQKIQHNAITKKIVTVGEMDQQPKNVIIQQSLQRGQLIHKIINVTSSGQSIVSPQIIQIHASNASAISSSTGPKTTSNISLIQQSVKQNSTTIFNDSDKHLNNISKIANANTNAIKSSILKSPIGSSASISKLIKTNQGLNTTSTLITKGVNCEQPNQIITLDNFIQKQQNQTLRISTTNDGKKSTPNIFQMATTNQAQGLTQYTVVSRPSVSNIQKVHGSIHNSNANAQTAPKIIHTIGAQQILNAKVIGKTVNTNTNPTTLRMINTTGLNLGSLKGKPVIIASTSNSSKSTILTNTTNSTSNSVFLSNSNILLGNQTMKLQGNILSQVPSTMQLVSQSVVPRTVSKTSITTTLASSNVGTITVNTCNINTPKSVVLAPSDIQSSPTIKLQTSSQHNPTATGTHVILGNSIKSQQIKPSPGQQRFVLAVQGGQQILLPHNFSTLKNLQGLKVVSLAPNNISTTNTNPSQQSKKTS